MADVRSMLRAERAARTLPKSLEQVQSTRPSKKRKADDEPADALKRTRGERVKDLPADFFNGGATDSPVGEFVSPLPGFVAAKEAGPQIMTLTKEDIPKSVSDTTTRAPLASPNKEQVTSTMDDEWAAFEQDIATVRSPPRQTALDALTNGTVISVAPVSAEEAAAQAREGPSTQRVGRAEEIEADKEDAARTLEAEFEEMEALEARVKRLREKREQLRGTHPVDAMHVESSPATPQEEDQKRGSDDDDDGDEWDGWRFGTS